MRRTLLAGGFLASILALSSATAQTDPALLGKTITQIRVSELKYVKRQTVLDQLASQVGQPLTARNLRKDAENLDRLSVFSSIELVPVTDGEGVALEVNLSEISRMLPYPSIDVNAENGFSVGGGVKWANPARQPTLLSVAARFGGSTQLEAIYERQWLARRPLFYRLEFLQTYRFNELDLFDETASRPDVWIGGRLNEAVSLGGRIRFLSLKSDQDGITSSPDNRDNLFSFGPFLALDTRDSWFNPHRGWQNQVELLRTEGDGNYWTANFDIRRYQPVADRHTIAVFSYTSIQSGKVGQQIPIYQDFQIGDTNTIRGWDISARRGKNQFINTLEYRYDLIPPRPVQIWKFKIRAGVQLAAFGDLGTAWDERDQFTKNFIAGGGVGIRLLLPWIQMIRLDLGFGQSGTGPHTHIGTYEKAYWHRRRVR